jgi:sigma-E factor negative regulatory protein RseA
MVMERISALMDGELDDDEAARELAQLKQDSSLRDGWDTFHMIGDVMRGAPVLSAGFERRLAERLDTEPTILAPSRARTRRIPPTVSYGLSAAASLAAVAAVAWVALSGTPPGPANPVGYAAAPGAPVTAATSVAPVASSVPNVPDAGRTHDYLLAHQGVSPSTAFQGVAPYVRTVSVRQRGDGR